MLKHLNIGYKSGTGFLLVFIIFLLPIFYASFQPIASPNISMTNSASENNHFVELIYKDKINQLDSFVNTSPVNSNFQGNMLVGYKGNVLYTHSDGYADPRKKTALNENSIFQLASVSKQFTAFAIMMLKERGKLSYSDTVNKYIPNFPYDGITIRMLLNHTAGLPNYMWLLENYWNKNSVPYNDDVLDLMAEHNLKLYFNPGTRFSYSNTGYIILASLVERISEQRFDKFLEENIFEPLEMDNTYLMCLKYDNNEELLKGYYKWGNSYRQISQNINDATVGDKGVYSTIKDLFKWDMALYENKLIKEETKQEAYKKAELKNGNHYPYGFGFRIKEHNNKKVVYHYGKWNGFRTGIIRFVEDTNTIILLNNTNATGASNISESISDILYYSEN
ncbi:MAG: serine hydrolase domain-containing protein [Bacteroidales bacterium]